MKVINLDKFKTETQVQLDGKTYTVKGMTVEQWLNDSDGDGVEKTEREKFVETLDRIAGMSDIPVEVLKVQQFSVLTALMQVAQGLDPNAPKEEGDEGK